MKNLYILFVTIFAFASCQKPINIKLKSSESQTVIEAKYSSLDQGINVFVSKSATYFGNDTIHGITNADIILIIGDTTVRLKSIQNGYYTAPLSKKYLYKSYKLSVISEGKTYEATSSMPKEVKIDSIIIKQSEGLMARSGGNTKDTTTQFTVNVYFKDPIGSNYYKIIMYKNGERLTDDPNTEEQVFDDSYFKSNTTINMPLAVKCIGNEKITAEIMSIDKASYDYYMSLITTLNSAGGSFSVPENPLSNFNNNALGYFSAYGSDTVSAIVPKPKKIK
jgi:hypothetical protein